VITSPIRPRDRQESGIAAASQLTHPRNALRRFTLVRNHNAPMASFRHALTEAPQRSTKPHWNRPVNSEPRPCLFGVGFPLSGPQVRTHTSDLIRHALRTRRSLRDRLRDDRRILAFQAAIRQHQDQQQPDARRGHFKPSRRGQCGPSFSTDPAAAHTTHRYVRRAQKNVCSPTGYTQRHDDNCDVPSTRTGSVRGTV
jgi:hypothetical protein